MEMCKIITITLLLLVLCSLTNAQITGIKINGDTCTSQTLDLQALGTSSSPYFFWDFDDPASGTNDTITITGLSPSPFPTHTFTSPGVYNVCVSFQEPGFPVSIICRTISIGLCCNGIIVTNDSCLQNAIPFSLNTSATINTINWNFGDPTTGANNLSSVLNSFHTFSSVGTYTVTATVNATCGTFVKTISKNIISCSPEACTGTILFSDSCENLQTTFQISSNYSIDSVLWNFGDISSGLNNNSNSISPTHLFSGTGNYNVKAIVYFSCGIDTIEKYVTVVPCDSTTSTNCKLYLPNTFSPNNDDLNEYFYPLVNSNCLLTEYKLLIFNRWGELIYESSSPNNKWDGKFKKQDCPIGTYFYLIKYRFSPQKQEIIKGDVTIIR